jgi:hypothetical protein
VLRLRLGKLRCPYCHGSLSKKGRAARTLVSCARCRTPHHAACFAENGRCTALGCGARRVVLEAEAVSIADLVGIVSSEELLPRARGRFSVIAALFALFVHGLVLAALPLVRNTHCPLFRESYSDIPILRTKPRPRVEAEFVRPVLSSPVLDDLVLADPFFVEPYERC